MRAIKGQRGEPALTLRAIRRPEQVQQNSPRKVATRLRRATKREAAYLITNYATHHRAPISL
jgi:hypothetical protein